jgi:eukaryotic-like serine/threonine-protein kinase
MGVVYAVEHTSLPRRYALKVLRRRFARRNDFAERLQAEAQCLTHLASHPNVVRVVDTGVLDDGRVYLLMELLEGRTVRDELASHQPFPPSEACALVRQLLLALGAAHRIGVIHRDVKPSNIFLTSAGPVKLLDFSVAKVVNEGLLGAMPKPMTEPGSALGTLRYMAPEYLIGGQAADGRVDLYSAGVVLWEMLAGRSPFPGAGDDEHDRAQLVHAIVTQGVPALEAAGFGHLQPDLRAVVRRATASDPNQRYASAEAFIAELDAVASRSSRPSPSERTQVMAQMPAPVPIPAPPRAPAPSNHEAPRPPLPTPAPGFAPNNAPWAFAPQGGPTGTQVYDPGSNPVGPQAYAPNGAPMPPPAFAQNGAPAGPQNGAPAGVPPFAPPLTAPAAPGYPPQMPQGASLLPSSATHSGRRVGISYQVVLGVIIFSFGFLASAGLVWKWTRRANANPSPDPTAQGAGATPGEPVAEVRGDAPPPDEGRAQPEAAPPPPEKQAVAEVAPPPAPTEVASAAPPAEAPAPPPAEAAPPAPPPAEAAPAAPPAEAPPPPPVAQAAAEAPPRPQAPDPAPPPPPVANGGGQVAAADPPPAPPSAGDAGKGKPAVRGGKPSEGVNPSPFAPPKRKFRPGF